MYFNDIDRKIELPIYEVKELSMEEALLVLAAEKESLKGQPASFDQAYHQTVRVVSDTTLAA